jgi:chromosomal replication initiation ATPase DnaA
VNLETRAELEAICGTHGLTLADVKTKKRFKAFVAARRECYAHLLAKGWSTVQVGRWFERDHSSVVSAMRTPERQARHAALRREYHQLRKLRRLGRAR